MSNKEVKQTTCSKEVKDFATKFLAHKKCTSRSKCQYASKVNGKFLNDYVHQKQIFADVIKDGYTTKPFEQKKNYFICSNLKRSIDQHKNKLLVPPNQVKLENANPPVVSSKHPSDAPSHHSYSRAERAFMRNRIPVKSLKGIKLINLKIAGDDDVVIDMKDFNTTKGMSYTKNFEQDVLHESKKYKIPFGSLTMRQKKLRTNDFCKKIFAACIDRKQFKKKGTDYIIDNEDLAVDMINLLDNMKNTIQSKMKMNFKDILDVPIAPVPNDIQGSITTLDENKDSHKIAISLMCQSSRRGYQRMRFNMDTFVSIPTYEELTKNRPAITGYELKISDSVYTTSVLNNNTPNISEEEELESVLRQISNSGDTFHAARIEGGYSKYIDILEENHSRHEREIDSNSNVLVIDSIDGAEHTKSNKKSTSIISFSSTLMSPEWINSKTVTAGSSLNILTWQQVKAVEKYNIMMASTSNYFEQKKTVRDQTDDEKRKNYKYYDLHDGKMLYLLTQHSAWNRKEHPFILCECTKGKGVVNNQVHQCKIISNDEQVLLYENSKKQYEKYSRRAIRKGKEYTKKEHMDWVDVNNKGVSHFGIHPSLLPRDSLRFDTFHMKCAITRRLMTYLRSFMLNQEPTVVEEFQNVLRKFWNEYHIFIWNNRKKFSSFHGNELALFTGNVILITTFMKNYLVPTRTINDIMDGLNIWVKLFKFVGYTYLVMSESEYLVMLDSFNSDVKEFYSVGSRTFLSSHSQMGEDETFYMHTLRYYIPRIALETYKTHKVGVGVFNMQGFERRNKESKNCLKRFSNNSGNVVINNIARIYDVFEHKVNAL